MGCLLGACPVVILKGQLSLNICLYGSWQLLLFTRQVLRRSVTNHMSAAIAVSVDNGGLRMCHFIGGGGGAALTGSFSH